MPKVDYTNAHAVWARVLRRRFVKVNRPLMGVNVATFRWQDGQNKQYVTTYYSGMDVSKHSEKEIWQKIQTRIAPKGLLWVYTEREPCGGCTKGCSKWFNKDILPLYGANGLLTPIFWTWPYPNDDGKGTNYFVSVTDFEQYTGEKCTEFLQLSGQLGAWMKKATNIYVGSQDGVIQSAYTSGGKNELKQDISTKKHDTDLYPGGITVELPDPRDGNEKW